MQVKFEAANEVTRVAYLADPGEPKLLFEFIEMNAAMRAGFAARLEAARTWQAKNPCRSSIWAVEQQGTLMSTWSNVSYNYRGAQVLVTGGTSGIGAGIAAAYRDAGAEVTITGTRKAASEYTEDLKGFRYLQLSLTDNAQITAVAAALPELDILVNNAGANFMLQNEYDPDIFEKGVRVNLTSAYRLSHALQPKLARSALPGGASVIGIASLTSYFGVEVVPAYGAAKAGIVQLMKTLSMAWAKDKIRVNAVAAGITESRMTAQMLSMPEMMAPVLARTPLGRPGKPIDVAGAVLFLDQRERQLHHRAALLVDGGYSIVG